MTLEGAGKPGTVSSSATSDPGPEPDRPAAPSPPRMGLAEGGGLFSLLVETVQDYAIFALDATGHVLTWNTGAQRIKGYRPEEILGQHFSAFYPPEDAGKTEWELEVAARDERFEDEGWRVRKDGSRFWANVVITALRNREGELVGFAKVTRDLTERREAEERALADAQRVAAAEAANEAKAQFLAMLSHELRTPLNAIGGYADLLAMELAGPMSELHREYVERIRRSQKHLLTVIEDLLSYSRIEAGRTEFEEEQVAMHEVAERALVMIAPQAAAAGITLAHDGCASGALALGDEPKVEQVILNLLSNAVKFTPTGGRVTVRCTVAERVAVHVSDTGPGIPANELEAIFEPFVQLGRELAHPITGTGLGLAISRRLARGMNGELSVESEPGVGSTFTLALRPAP